MPIEDAYICSQLAEPFLRVLEIGVYKGGWLFTMKDNQPNIDARGIDPYPNLGNIKSKFLIDSCKKNYKIPIQLYTDWAEFFTKNSQKDKFQLIHVDGEHSENAVANDLNHAFSFWDFSGVIIIDDFFSNTHPGVTNSALNFIKMNRLKAFLLTDKKIYICHSDYYTNYYSKAKQLLQTSGINYLDKQTNSFYDQDITIDSTRIIVKLPHSFIDDWNIIKNLQVTLPVTIRLKKVLKMLLPPLLIYCMQKIKSR